MTSAPREAVMNLRNFSNLFWASDADARRAHAWLAAVGLLAAITFVAIALRTEL
jgi:hypothetical protein